MKLRRSMAAVALAATTLTACSTATGGHAVAPPPTRAQLQRLLLQQPDFPAGTKSTPQSGDSSDASAQRQLARCVGQRDTGADQVAHVDAPQFTLPQDGTGVASSATSFKTQDDVDAGVSLLTSPKTPNCYKTMLRGQIEQQVGGEATVGPIQAAFAKGGAASNVAVTLTTSIGIHAGAEHTAVYGTIAFITGTLIGAEVEIERLGHAPSQSEITHYVSLVAGRVSRA